MATIAPPIFAWSLFAISLISANVAALMRTPVLPGYAPGGSSFTVAIGLLCFLSHLSIVLENFFYLVRRSLGNSLFGVSGTSTSTISHNPDDAPDEILTSP